MYRREEMLEAAAPKKFASEFRNHAQCSASAYGKRNFHFLHELRPILHSRPCNCASTLTPHKPSAIFEYRKRKWTARKAREIPSEMAQRAKSAGIGFWACKASWLEYCTSPRSAALLTKANNVARTGFRGSANDFLIKHVLCAVTRLDRGELSMPFAVALHQHSPQFKTLSAINTTAAFPLLSQSLLSLSNVAYVSNAVRDPCLRIVSPRPPTQP